MSRLSPGEAADATGGRRAAAARLAQRLRDAGVRTALLVGADTNGVLRGKRVGAAALDDALAHGIALSEAFWTLPFDEWRPVTRPPEDRGAFPRAGLPDVLARPDLATARLVPWQPGAALVLCDFVRDGAPAPLCPREVLRRVVRRAAGLGFTARVGVELELYLLAETPESAAAKRPGQLRSLERRPGAYGVAPRQDDAARLIADGLAALGLDVVAGHPEAGPGQLELTLAAADPLAAADAAVVLKAAVKDLAARLGLLATFMARPRADWPGSSCHLHLSLRADGRDAFAGPDDLTPAGRGFVAGLLATMPELTAIMAPTPNSYRRPRPQSYAATTATWSGDNRTAGLRVVAEGEDRTRVEHRQPGADVNPYLAVAAALAGGLDGVERGLEPPPPARGDVYAAADAPPLPADLADATARLQASAVARAWLGDDLVDHHVALRHAELAAAADAVTDWETDRYLEVV